MAFAFFLIFGIIFIIWGFACIDRKEVGGVIFCWAAACICLYMILFVI